MKKLISSFAPAQDPDIEVADLEWKLQHARANGKQTSKIERQLGEARDRQRIKQKKEEEKKIQADLHAMVREGYEKSYDDFIKKWIEESDEPGNPEAPSSYFDTGSDEEARGRAVRRTDTVNSKDSRRSRTARSLSRARKLAASVKDNFLNGVDAIAGVETNQPSSSKSSNRRGPPPAAGDRYKEVFDQPQQTQTTEISRTTPTRFQRENRPQVPAEEPPRPRFAKLIPGQPFPLNSPTSPTFPPPTSQKQALASPSSAQPQIQSFPVHHAYRPDLAPSRTHPPRTSSLSPSDPQSSPTASTSLPRQTSISRSRTKRPVGSYLADQIHAPRSPGLRRTDQRIPERRNQSPIRYLYPERGYYERPRRDGDDAEEDEDWRNVIDDEYADEKG